MRAQLRVLAEQASPVGAEAERAELNERMAALWKRLGDAGEAARRLEWRLSAALQEDPWLVPAAEALEKLLRARSAWRELAEHYRARLLRRGVGGKGEGDRWAVCASPPAATRSIAASL